MEIDRVQNVWESLSDSPEEAANLAMRSTPLLAVGDAVKGWGLPQAQAASRLGIAHPRFNDLHVRGKAAA